MRKVEFVIPTKPKLVKTTGLDASKGNGHTFPPHPRSQPREGRENFSANKNPSNSQKKTSLSSAPPHTKFAVIPSRAVTDPRINNRKPLLLLLGAIGIHASVHGICYPSQRRLAMLCGRSPSWANKYLHELIRMGYVKRLVPPKIRGMRQALRLQVMWSVSQPLPNKETTWSAAPWCWR